MAGGSRIGIIGSGGFARHHIQQFCEVPGASVTALCEPDAEQVARTRERFPWLAEAPVFAESGDLVRSGLVDAVLVSSPHTLHVGQTVEAFEAGLHCLVDKPLATTVEDAKRMIAARDASGRVGAIAYQRHGLPWFAWLRAEIAAGSFGRLLAVNAHLAQQWLQFTRGSWRQDPALSGGGQLNDSGSHMVDVLLWTTGLRAKRVGAMIDHRGSAVDIDSVVSVEFEGGAYGSLTIIGDAAMWHERHFLWFEQASVFLEDERVTVVWADGRRTVTDQWPGAVSPEQNFVDCVAGRAQPLAPFECGLATIELTEAAWCSGAQGGAPVEV